MNTLESVQRRILVTGTRGKSTLVRLLTGGFRTMGIPCWSRITGVIPTEFSPSGEGRIQRSAPTNIGELKWWLGRIPTDAEAVVVENSAVSPELQGLAARWLKPHLVIWINALSDHQEVWGPGKEAARGVLIEGIPKNVPCLLGPELWEDTSIRERLGETACALHGSSPGGRVLEDMALEAMKLLGIRFPSIDEAKIPEDPGAFRVVEVGGGRFAFAFSANEPDTTEELWKELGWDRAETTLLYNHRRDRPGRLKSFLPFLECEGWKEVIITGSHPLRRLTRVRFLPLSSPGEMEELVRRRGRVFGCGNVAGLPLMFMEQREKEEKTWTVS